MNFLDKLIKIDGSSQYAKSLPSIFVKESGTLCKYWFFCLIIIYLLTYFRLNSFVKKKIDI